MESVKVLRFLVLTGLGLGFLAHAALCQEAGFAPPPVGQPWQTAPPQFSPYAPPQFPNPAPVAPVGPAPMPVEQLPSLPAIDGDAIPPAAAAPAVVAAPAPPPKIWEGGLEIGLDGSHGNSRNFNLHLGANLKRKTEFNVLSSELDYKKNNADSVDTANKAFFEARFEHLFQQSRWTWFVHNIEDYDEFKAYDLRVSADTGLGYQLIKSESTTLTSRFGGGATQEIGGPDDELIPEVVFGLEGELKISKRQKLTASVEHRPDVTDFGNYRLNAKAAWELLVDEEKRLSLKLSVLDRYDSNADGRKPNDLDYSLTLLWGF